MSHRILTAGLRVITGLDSSKIVVPAGGGYGLRVAPASLLDGLGQERRMADELDRLDRLDRRNGIDGSSAAQNTSDTTA